MIPEMDRFAAVLNVMLLPVPLTSQSGAAQVDAVPVVLMTPLGWVYPNLGPLPLVVVTLAPLRLIVPR